MPPPASARAKRCVLQLITSGAVQALYTCYPCSCSITHSARVLVSSTRRSMQASFCMHLAPKQLGRLQMNQNTKRMEYEGSVFNTVMAMAEMAHGGQILVDEASFDGIKSSLAQVRARVSVGPNLENLQGLCR